MTAPHDVYAICVRNEGSPASLEVRKLYQGMPDAEAHDAGHIRVIDESGEDYFFPADVTRHPMLRAPSGAGSTAQWAAAGASFLTS